MKRSIAAALVIAVAAAVSLPSLAIDTESTGYKLLNGGTLTLTPSHSPSACRTLVNGSGAAQFIATKTATEWASVIASPPPSVTSTACGPTIVQTASASSGTTATTNLNLGFASNCTVGNTVIVGVMGRLSTDTVTAISGLGGTWTQATSASQTGNNIEVWRAKCLSAGTLVSITTGNTNVRVNIGMEVANIGTLVHTTTNDLGSDWTISGPVSPTIAPTFYFLAGVIDKQATSSGNGSGGCSPSPTTFSPIVLDAGTGGTRMSGGAYASILYSTSGTCNQNFTFSGTGSPTSTGVGVAFY